MSAFVDHTNNQYIVHPGAIIILLTLAAWVITWKGFALWRAGRNNEPFWFVALLVLNTAGILEILYMFYFSKQPSHGRNGHKHRDANH